MKNNWFNLLLFSLIVVCSFFSCRRDTPLENNINNNTVPVAIAGKDTIIVLPADSFALDGSESYDAEGSIGEYEWSKISGPSSFSITNSRSARAIAKNLVQGTYEFGLKVTDSAGLSAKDTITVRVVTPGTPCDMVNRSVIRARLEPLGMLSIGRIELLTAAANNKILFAGGFSYDIDGTGIPTRRIDIYDVSDHTWSTKDLPEYPTFRTDMGIASSGGKIFIAGGGFWGDDLYTNEVDIYNSSDNSWSKAGLSEGRTALTGVSSNNKVFFAGGSVDVYTASDRIDIYDASSNSWSTAQLSAKCRPVITVVGKKLWFAIPGTDKIDIYDPDSNTWTTQTVPTIIAGTLAVSLKSKVFFTGSRDINVYDTASNSWSVLTLSERKFLIPVGVSNDKIAFIGGMTSWFVYSTTIEIYDPFTNKWTISGMKADLYYSAIISHDNYIYIAGGFINQENNMLDRIYRFSL